MSSRFEKEMIAGHMHARRPAYRRKVEEAREGIRAMRDLAPRAYASLSFGKQSLCMADLLQEIALEVPFYFLASGESWDLHNYAEVIESFLEDHPEADVTIVQTNVVGLDIEHHISALKEACPSITFRRMNWHPPEGDWKTCRDRGDEDLQNMCDRENWEGWYMGLAKEESRGRAITLSKTWKGQPHPSIFRYKDGKYRCCPLRSWTTQDVAAYVATQGVPLLDAYLQDGLSIRTTARLTKMSVQKGELTRLRERNPSAYRRLCARFPELRNKLYEVPYARN